MDPIWDWLCEANWRDCDLDGLHRFLHGWLLPILLGLFVLVNLLIPILVMVRCFRRSLILDNRD